MRFNDGFWILKSGVKPYWGLQVVQATQTSNGFDLQVSTKPVRHRGDTLAGENALHNLRKAGYSLRRFTCHTQVLS